MLSHRNPKRPGTRGQQALATATISLLALATLPCSSQATVIKVAGERGGFWEASFFLNYVDGETLDFDNDGEAKVDSSLGWGIGIHYNFDNHWNLGLDMAFNRPDYSTRFPDLEDDDKSVYIDHTASRFDGQIDLQYNILRGPITPYLQAGLGWTFMDSNIVKSYSTYCGGYYYPVCRTYADTFDDTSFSYNLGLGLRWDINDSVFLRGAYIQQWIDSDGSPNPFNARLEVGFMF